MLREIHVGRAGITARWAFAIAAMAGGVVFGQTEERGAPPVPDLCAFTAIYADARDFAIMFADSTADLDDDGLPDEASLALVREVACNPDAPASLALATGTAYDANLALFDGEADTTGLEDFREAIAALMLTSATTEAAVKAALASAAPPITLAADYAQVTCASGACMPVPVRDGLPGEFFDFESAPRAANEPYAADGDLDEDGTNNVTEYNNIEAQGGERDEFVVAATSPDLDGTEPVRGSGGGGGGCFIATAAYGTPLADQIYVLRRLRDGSLLGNSAGAVVADVYYRLSPPIALRVAESDALAGVVRALLVPIVALARGGFAAVAAVVVAMCALAAWRRATCPAHRPRTARGR